MTTRNLTLPIVAVIAALSARPAWAAGCMPSQPGAPYTILLEFAGHQDASYEIAGQSPVAVEVPPFQGAQTVRDEICERVAEDFSPFNVNVTTAAPPDFMPGLRTGVIAAIGGKGGEIGVRGNISSVLEHVALLTEFDQNDDPISAKEIASSVSHEMGHILASWTAVPMSHYTPALPATPDHNLIAQGKTQIMGGVRSQTLRDIWWKDDKTLLYLIPSAEGVPLGCYRQKPDDPNSPLWCCDEQFECVADPSGDLWRIGLQEDVAILLAALGPRPDQPRGPVPYGANTPEEGLPMRAEGMTPAGDEVLGGAGIVEMNAASFPRTCAPWETPSCVARRQWSNPPQERDFFKFRVAGNGTFKAYVVTIDEMDSAATKANLDAGIELYRKIDDTWNPVPQVTELHGASDTWAGLEAAVTAQEQWGLYALAAKSAEEYGDLGQYTVRVEGPNVESIISNLRLEEEQELQALDLGAGDLWYRIETKRGGPLLITASAKDERSDIVLKLYDGTLRELAASDRLAASLRHRAAEGGAYYLQVSGRSDSLGLRLQIGGMPINHPRSEEAAKQERE